MTPLELNYLENWLYLAASFNRKFDGGVVSDADLQRIRGPWADMLEKAARYVHDTRRKDNPSPVTGDANG